jgi:uncharacterized protein YndB with AHSA1/START domain
MLPAVLCSRWYAAPAGLIFRAFTEPELLEQWFCPSPEIAVRIEQCEPRPGGTYRFLYYFPDGAVVAVTGEYQSVTPARQLIFTWTWEPPDPSAGVITLVTIDLADRDGGTEVSVRHEQFPTPAMRSRHEAGWTSTLARLEALCEKTER